MATCKIIDCTHTVRRSADSKMLGWSWNEYGICTCCVNELLLLGANLESPLPSGRNYQSLGCNKQIALEVKYPNKRKMIRNRIG